MSSVKISPTSLLNEIKIWNSISGKRDGEIQASFSAQGSSSTSIPVKKRWCISESGQVQVSTVPKEAGMVHRIQSLWQGHQDLGHVFHNMYSSIQKVNQEKLVKVFTNENSKKRWEKQLIHLKEQILARKRKYISSPGSIKTIYRVLAGSCSNRGQVEERTDKLLDAIETLLKKCSTTPSVSTQSAKTGSGHFSTYSLPRDRDLRNLVLQEIDKAQHSITIFMYSITDLQIMEALEHKAKNGITVTLLCEKNAFEHAKRKIDTSVHVEEIDCDGLMHLKLLVIDGKNVVFGSANLTTGGLTHDKNIMTVVKSQKLAQLVLNKAKTCAKKVAIPGVTALSSGNVCTLKSGQHIDFSFLPDEKADQKLLNLIQGAKKTLKIAMFTWTHKSLAQAVIEKHKKGVKVTAVIDGGQGGPQGTGNTVTQMLTTAGVNVILSKANKFKLMHHKLMLIDEETVVHGSMNWTNAACKKNLDCFAVITNLAEDDRKNFTSIWEDLLVSVQKK